MDVYGYANNYQFNPSDELAKQLFAQQALASSAPYGRDLTEPHAMPAPSGAPWNVHGLSWGMSSPPQLVHFTAQPPNVEPKHVIHCKRKSLDVEPVIPVKQFITEEKMIAHLNGLHISSQYRPHTLASEESMDLGVESLPSISDNTRGKLKGHRIVLSEELKKLKDEPLLPPSLIERLEKPTMSLVLWKPRDNIIEKIKEEEDKGPDSIDEEPKQRNGILVPEFTSMDVEM